MRAYTREEILGEIDRYSCRRGEASPCWDYGEAVATFTCESGLSQFARSPAGAIGVAQLHPEDSAAYDVRVNLSMAYAKFVDGWNHDDRWYHWSHFGGCGHF